MWSLGPLLPEGHSNEEKGYMWGQNSEQTGKLGADAFVKTTAAVCLIL